MSKVSPVARAVQAPERYHLPSNPKTFLSWKSISSRLRRSRCYWLATTPIAGPPHLTPVWGLWLDDTLYFDGDPQTHWAIHLARHPQATIHLKSPSCVIVVEGHVSFLKAAPSLTKRLLAAHKLKYDDYAPTPKTGIFRLTPTRARAWSEDSLSDATAWDFTHVRAL